MRRLTALVAICVASVALAACGGGGSDSSNASAQASGAPGVKQLLTDSAKALDGVKSAHFDLSLKGNGSSSDPTAAKLLSEPLALDLNGDAGKEAVDLEGSVAAVGKTFAMGVRADKQHSYVKFGDNWYGPSSGLDSSNSNANDLPKLVAFLQKHGDQLLTGKTVQDGPTIGGDDTWKVSGQLDPDGIIAAAKEEGKPMTADGQSGLRAIAPLVHVTYAAGKEDHLPRQVQLAFDINKDQIQALEKLSGKSASDLKLNELHLSMSLELTKWNEPVSVEKPSDVQPMKALNGALLGALGQALQTH